MLAINMNDLKQILLPIGFFITIIGIHYFYGYISNNDLENRLKEYYEDKKITEITKLRPSEKIRNGVPNNLYFRIFSKGFTIFSRFESNYYRVIEFENGSEIFVEMKIRRKRIIELKEFKG